MTPRQSGKPADLQRFSARRLIRRRKRDASAHGTARRVQCGFVQCGVRKNKIFGTRGRKRTADLRLKRPQKRCFALHDPVCQSRPAVQAVGLIGARRLPGVAHGKARAFGHFFPEAVFRQGRKAIGGFYAVKLHFGIVKFRGKPLSTQLTSSFKPPESA